MVLPIALAYTITGRYKPLTKVGLGYAAVVILAGIGVTLSRGGYLAAGVSLMVFFVILLWNRDFRIPALDFDGAVVAGGAAFRAAIMAGAKTASTVRCADMRREYWERGGRNVEGEFLVWGGAAAL